MSPRSIRLRFQADKCRSHARSMSMSNVVTQTALRKLADEYTAQAEEIESKESRPTIEDGSPPSVASWCPRRRQALCPLAIAPTHDDAALMILRRYCNGSHAGLQELIVIEHRADVALV